MNIDIYIPTILNDLDYSIIKDAGPLYGVFKKRMERSYYRTRLAESQNWKCAYCMETMNTTPGSKKQVTFDHFIPASEGGSDDMSNGVAACNKCNRKRGTTDALTYFNSRTQIPKDKINSKVRRYSKRSIKLFPLGNCNEFEIWLDGLSIKQKHKDEIRQNFLLATTTVV